MSGTIYALRNTINDKVYIGQTTGSLKERLGHHLSSCKIKSKQNMKLYKAMNEIGAENFYIEPLEENIPAEMLFEKECEYIQKFNSHRDGYNTRAGWKGGRSLTKEESETALRMAKSGANATEIANKFGVNTATIFRTLDRLGFKFINTDHGKIISMFEEGVSYKQIAEAVGVDLATVQRHLRADGLRRRKVYTNKRHNFDYESLKNDYNNQMAIADICDKYSITTTTFYRIKDKLSLQTRPHICKEQCV